MARAREGYKDHGRVRYLAKNALVRASASEAVYYPNAYHSFDSRLPDRTVAGAGKSHHLAYDPAAAPDAEARTKAFFAKYLNRP